MLGGCNVKCIKGVSGGRTIISDLQRLGTVLIILASSFGAVNVTLTVFAPMLLWVLGLRRLRSFFCKIDVVQDGLILCLDPRA